MSIEAAMQAQVLADATVAGLVGTRVYTDVMPRAAMPYVVTQLISNANEHHLGGASGLSHARVQFRVVAESPASREAVGQALREALDGYPRGALGSGDIAVEVESVVLDSSGNSYEPPTDAGEVGRYTRRMDFMCWHEETVPTFD